MKAWRDESTGRWHTDLPDVFDEICKKLIDRESFSFARYGDGEWNAIYGKIGRNCDGHEYFSDMGTVLKKSVIERNNCYMGLQPLTISSPRMSQIEIDFPNINWVDADCIHNASIDGKLTNLFNALSKRQCLLIGPEHLQQLRQQMFIIPSKNCWNMLTPLANRLSDFINANAPGLVILLCASMMSEVLIDHFHGENRCTIIDLGSVLDPYAGVKSRSYHYKLKSNASMP